MAAQDLTASNLLRPSSKVTPPSNSTARWASDLHHRPIGSCKVDLGQIQHPPADDVQPLSNASSRSATASTIRSRSPVLHGNSKASGHPSHGQISSNSSSGRPLQQLRQAETHKPTLFRRPVRQQASKIDPNRFRCSGRKE
ncbi:hypothetical protein ACLOJK_019071 [Asimina triloba]